MISEWAWMNLDESSTLIYDGDSIVDLIFFVELLKGSFIEVLLVILEYLENDQSKQFYFSSKA